MAKALEIKALSGACKPGQTGHLVKNSPTIPYKPKSVQGKVHVARRGGRSEYMVQLLSKAQAALAAQRACSFGYRHVLEMHQEAC